MAMLLRQAKVIDPSSPFHGQVVDLLFENGAIKTIAAKIDQSGVEEVSGEGLCISNGWVDVLADYREPGYEQKETIATGLNAAAAGGFTDVFLAPNTNHSIDSRSSVEAVIQK